MSTTSRFLAACHDLDREAERSLRLPEEYRGVLCDPQRVGAERAHGRALEAAQPLAEALEAGEGPLLHGFVEALVFREALAQSHRLAQGIEGIELVADHARHLAMKTV
jgi:hypothetical protein